jgi:hypothetical protein
MVGITAVVWLRLYVERIGEMRVRRIPAQALSTSREAAATLQRVNAADNLRNLFEIPVLFYALCVSLLAAQAVDQVYLTGAWLYVVLRAAHSYIHCTYNRVMHRFAVYSASTLLVFAMWARLGVYLVSRA